MKLTEWDSQLLHRLGWQIRAIDRSRLCREQTREFVERRISFGQRHGLLETSWQRVAVFELEAPLMVGPTASFEADAKECVTALRKRWQSAQYKLEQVIWISRRGINLFGGYGGRLRQRLQLQHDLLAGEVLFTKSQDEQDRWVGEDWFRELSLCHQMNKLPDAVVLDKYGRLETFVEVGGQYSLKTLTALHQAALQEGVRYEVW